MKKTCKNPIIPGFYPDPSICRVNQNYYLVHSTFAYFPAVPIFHSTDLVHWQQIGNVLDRTEQVNLLGAEHSGGIYAPTLRYHNGTYYVITTNVTHGGNFIVTATNPAGPWSKPYFLAGAAGIDPSLFFDDNGKCYYTGTRPRTEGSNYFGDNEIYLQELDLVNMKLIGPAFVLWHGALNGVEWPEGPHLYKKDGYYYLMIAEGGTGHNHAITIARSTSLASPFVGCPYNPILTHRHLGRNYPIVNVGHGDLVETQNGQWWMVVLASRPYGGYYRNLGRETFLVPVTWENDWPIVNYGIGLVEATFTPPVLSQTPQPSIQKKEDFNQSLLPYHFIYLRNPNPMAYSLTQRNGYLRMLLMPETISEKVSPSFVGVRQTNINFVAKTNMLFEPKNEHECAGLVILQNNAFYYQLTATIKDGNKNIILIKSESGEISELAAMTYDTTELYLKIQGQAQALTFSYSINDKDYVIIADHIDGRILSPDVAGGFVGTCIGMYCSSNGKASDNYVDFDWFYYE